MASIEGIGTPTRDRASGERKCNARGALRWCGPIAISRRLFLRIGLGLVMFPHGAQKALGWFGGGGFAKTMAYFTESVHMPAVLGVLVIAAEFFGSLLLLAGIFTRFAAFSIALVMAGAAVLVHAPNGFFMNWFGNQAGEGFEFHLIAIAIAGALVLRGGGRSSLDRMLAAKISELTSAHRNVWPSACPRLDNAGGRSLYLAGKCARSSARSRPLLASAGRRSCARADFERNDYRRPARQGRASGWRVARSCRAHSGATTMLDSNDHRSLGQRLDLFHFQEEAPGMAFWHPRGFVLYRLLEHAVRAQFTEQGYQEVRTPQLLRKPVWEASGHWRHFQGGMFTAMDGSEEAALKPVSCPGHVYLVRRDAPSYRDLPIRVAEFGIVHRDEPSGTLHGLLRLRQFTQDDGHIFCEPEQAEDEVEAFCRASVPSTSVSAFPMCAVVLATRPEESAGDDASWARAESALRNVLARLGVAYSEQPGGGAFYGPKLEFVLQDRHGRDWSCGTIQFDLVMPPRFDLRYVDAGGERRHPVMLHRALYGSLERFFGMLLEHYGAALPAWLCPLQVLVMPIAEAHEAWATAVVERLRGAGLRVASDFRRETLAKRIAEAHAGAVPFVAVIGGPRSRGALGIDSSARTENCGRPRIDHSRTGARVRFAVRSRATLSAEGDSDPESK